MSCAVSAAVCVTGGSNNAAPSATPQLRNTSTSSVLAGRRIRRGRHTKPGPSRLRTVCSENNGSKYGDLRVATSGGGHSEARGSRGGRRVPGLLASIGVGVGLVVAGPSDAATAKEQQELARIVEARTGVSGTKFPAPSSPRMNDDASVRAQRKLSPELLKDIQRQRQHEIADSTAGGSSVPAEPAGVKASPDGSGVTSQVLRKRKSGFKLVGEKRVQESPREAEATAPADNKTVTTVLQGASVQPATGVADGKMRMSEDQVAEGVMGAVGLLLVGGAGVAVSRQGEAQTKRRTESAEGVAESSTNGAEDMLRQATEQVQSRDKLLQHLQSTLRETEESAAKQVLLERQAAETARTEKDLMQESLMAEMQLVDAMRDECMAMDNVLAAEEESLRWMEQEARGVFDALEKAKDIIKEGRDLIEWNDFDLMTKRFNEEVAARAALRAGLEEAESAIDEQIEGQQQRIEQVGGEGINGLIGVLSDMKEQAFEMVQLAESLTNEAAKQKAKADAELDHLRGSSSEGTAGSPQGRVNGDYREALQASQKEADKLRADLMRAKGLAYQLNEQANYLRNNTSSMEQRLATEEASGRAARAEAAALRDRLEVLQRHLADGGTTVHYDQESNEAILRHELSSALQHLEMQQDTSKQLRTQVEKLEWQVSVLTAEKDKANGRVAVLTARLAESQQIVDGFSERLKEERAARDDATAAVLKLQNVILSAKFEMEEATSTVESARQELDGEKMARQEALKAISGLVSQVAPGDGQQETEPGPLADGTPGNWSPPASVVAPEKGQAEEGPPAVGSWEPPTGGPVRNGSALQYARGEMLAMKARNEEVWRLVEREQATIEELRKELSELRKQKKLGL